MSSERNPRILLVDDDPQVLNVYRGFLEGPYELETATSGEAALDALSAETDVVLLDRRMPGMDGDEVLEAIRHQGYDCRVAMVTALKPEMDIIDMGVDDYLVKPVTRSKLTNVVDSLLRWGDYDEVLAEYFELAKKTAVLEEEYPQATLDTKEEYRRLKERLSTLQTEADQIVEGAGSDIVGEILGGVADEDSADGEVEPAEFPSR